MGSGFSRAWSEFRFRKSQCAQRAGSPAEGWRDDEFIQRTGKHRRGDVAIQQSFHLGADGWEEGLMFHHSSAEDDPLRGEGQDDVHQGVGDIPGFLFPGGVMSGESFSRFSPAAGESGSACHTLEAIPMEGTGAGEWVPLAIMRQAQVTRFGMG